MPMTVRTVKVLTFKGMDIKSDLSLCWTNLCVDTLKSKNNDKYANTHHKVKEAKGYGNTTIIVHQHLQLMTYITSLNKTYYNSEYVVVVDVDDEYVYLKNTPWRYHKDRH